jgi:serine phosphatase RsbU (regulator of sigma subunit)
MREKRIIRIVASLALAIVLIACSDSKTKSSKSTADEYQAAQAKSVSLLNQNPEEAFRYVDSLESSGNYPECVINMIRGVLNARVGNMLTASSESRKAITPEMHDIWPKGYYQCQYNLCTVTMMRGNMGEAIQQAQAATAQLKKDNNPDYKVWEASLQFVLGNCQLILKQKDDGKVSMQKAYDVLMDLAATDTTHVTLETMGTLMANIATSYYNSYPDLSMPWIERAEKFLDMMAERNKKTHLPSAEPMLRAKVQLCKAMCYVSNGREAEAHKVYEDFMKTPFAQNPAFLIEQLSYLEKTNQWDAAADMLDPIYQLHKAMGMDYSMENLSNLAESFRVYEKAGRKAEAYKMAQELAGVVDSVWHHQLQDNAAELTVIYATQQKDQQIAEQQYKLSRQRSITGGIVAVLVIIGLAIFIFFRHRAAKRLEVAHEELKEAYDQLEETTTAKERIESELRIARDIQMSMVPHEFPDREGLDVFAKMTPAKEVGGDLYGYVLLGDKFYFAIGDVSGKGVPASLFMAQATRLFRTLSVQGMMPAEICTSMNAALTEDNQQGMFVTFWLGLLDLKTGHLDFCNAGHNPPVLGSDKCCTDETCNFLEMIPNAPIGLFPGLEYEGEEVDNIKGCSLFIYTDGLNEAENRQQEQFGDDRLLDILRTSRSENAQQLVEMLAAEVEQHRDGAEPNDDLTMMCIRIKG